MLKVLISGDTRYGANRKIIKGAVEETLRAEKISSDNIEVSVHLVGQRKIKALSENYLEDGEKHAVLSFAQEELDSKTKGGFVNPPDGVLRLGDIVVCWPFLLEEAAERDVMVDDQLSFLVSHATGHLLGKHHE